MQCEIFKSEFSKHSSDIYQIIELNMGNDLAPLHTIASPVISGKHSSCARWLLSLSDAGFPFSLLHHKWETPIALTIEVISNS